MLEEQTRIVDHLRKRWEGGRECQKKERKTNHCSCNGRKPAPTTILPLPMYQLPCPDQVKSFRPSLYLEGGHRF